VTYVDVVSAWRDDDDGYPLAILLFAQKQYMTFVKGAYSESGFKLIWIIHLY
jgi:hypothetical protein